MTRPETEAHTAYAARPRRTPIGSGGSLKRGRGDGRGAPHRSQWGLREGIVLEAAGIADALKVDDRGVLAGSH
jgi:hypothetical protein